MWKYEIDENHTEFTYNIVNVNQKLGFSVIGGNLRYLNRTYAVWFVAAQFIARRLAVQLPVGCLTHCFVLKRAINCPTTNLWMTNYTNPIKL